MCDNAAPGIDLPPLSRPPRISRLVRSLGETLSPARAGTPGIGGLSVHLRSHQSTRPQASMLDAQVGIPVRSGARASAPHCSDTLVAAYPADALVELMASFPAGRRVGVFFRYRRNPPYASSMPAITQVATGKRFNR